MEIRRSGNFGIIDTGTDKGLISFSIGGRGKGWEPSSIQLNRRGAFFSRKISVNGTFIVPMGDNNDMPGEVMRLLDKFYAGEGIMGKIAGLQWGEGPRLYEDAIDEDNNRFYRRWKLDPEITADLESWDYTTVLHRSLVDLTHMQGFFIKFVRVWAIPGVWYGWNIFPIRRPAWYILPTARMNRRKYLWATFLILIRLILTVTRSLIRPTRSNIRFP